MSNDNRVALVRVEPGHYETPNGRWRVRQNDGTGCAPESWWLLFYHTNPRQFLLQTETLRAAKQVIETLDRDFVRIEVAERRNARRSKAIQR
jgi:hypothetical protein